MIYIASDHKGFELKKEISRILDRLGQEFKDLGPEKYDREDDYPKFAFNVAEKVSKSKNLGILLCGTGIGMSIAANKVKGVRAGLVSDDFEAMRAKKHDNINILVLSTEHGEDINYELIIKTWLETEFSKEPKYLRRIKEITAYENSSNHSI